MKKKKQGENDIPWKTIFLYMLAMGLDKLSYVAHALTKYPPFDLIPDSYPFHYTNKLSWDIENFVIEYTKVFPAWRAKDLHFFYLFYDPKRISLEKLQEVLKDKEVKVYDREVYLQVSIPRG